MLPPVLPKTWCRCERDQHSLPGPCGAQVLLTVTNGDNGDNARQRVRAVVPKEEEHKKNVTVVTVFAREIICLFIFLFFFSQHHTLSFEIR
jgi:hypothetical protein